MSKIKVYVRVRPALPKEFDAPGCFNCTELEDVSGNWINIKKEGEPKRYFARVWGPQSSQEEAFRTVGVNTVNDVFEGYYGCIFVYGQTGTGKTFTLGCLTPGLEGIQPRCLQFAFEKAQKESARFETTIRQQYVQLYRDNVQDLLHIMSDNMVLRVDEKDGAIIEGCTTREVTCYEEAVALIQEGDSNRSVANTKMNSASSRSHACLITEVTRKEKATGNVTLGRLYLIDLAGSERPAKSGVEGDAYKEAVAINKSLTCLGNCISGLVNGEKVVAFRDSKLTRLLQHSLSGHGRTSIVVTIRPDSPNMQETLCTLKFGERAQKVETQMTPAAYREQVLEKVEQNAESETATAEAQSYAYLCKAWQESIAAAVREKEAANRALDMETKDQVVQVKAAHEDTKKALEATFNKENKEANAVSLKELERLKTANASVLAQIDERVADAEKKLKEKQNPLERKLADELATVRREHKKLQGEVDAVQPPEGEDDDPQARAAKALADMQARVDAAKRKLRGCKPSRNDGLNIFELREKQKAFEEILDKLLATRSRLQGKCEGWNQEAMEKAFPAPPPEDLTAFVSKVQAAPPPAEEKDGDDDDGSAPPSSEPPPSDSDEDSDDSDSDSDSDSDDSDNSDESDSDSGSAPEEGEKAVTLNMEMEGAASAMPKVKIEKKQLEGALKRDAHLAELLEQILEYLEYGSTAYLVYTDLASTPGAPEKMPAIVKKHIFLAKGRKLFCCCDLKSDGSPDRTKTMEICKVSEISGMTMGQFSDGFQKALEGAPMVPQGTPMPENSSKITMNSLPIFFYRSLSVEVKKKTIVDVVLDADTDFEAWIVSLHRLSMKDPVWGGPLDISGAREAVRLSEEEKKLCVINHILPSSFIQTKNTILHKDPKMFYTLFDIRTISSMDLFHSQRLFEFFVRCGYIERVSVYHIRYLDLMREQEEEKKRKEELRSLRTRIYHMLRKYKKSSAEEIQAYLKTIVGQEQAEIENLVKTHGPEPSAEEIAAMGEAAVQMEDAAPKEDKKSSKGGEDPQDPPPPPPEGEAPPPPPPE